MSAVLITAVQSVKIFGFWRQPVLTLSWTDVKQHNLTWRQPQPLMRSQGPSRRPQIETSRHSLLPTLARATANCSWRPTTPTSS